MNASAQGDQALSNSDPLSAIKHYTQALVELPRAPIYYIKRSTAHSRVKAADGGPRSAAALQDAEIALVLARERGRRELMLSAQMRRGVALYQLERVGDAGFVFDTIKEKTTGVGGQTKDRTEEVRDAMASKSAKNGYDQELPIWMAKVKGRLRKLEEGDEKGKVSVGEYPSSVQIPTEKELKEQLAHIKAGKVVTGGGDFPKSVPVGEQKPQDAVNTTTQSSQGGVTAPAAAPAAPGPVNVRHEWYQSHDSVVVTLYVKGIAKEKVNSDIENDSINIQFPLPTGTDYAFSLDPLFAPIDPSASKISVMGTKIEIILHKQTSGQKWSSLESTATGTKLTDRAATTAPNPKPAAADAASPSYPTSSRHGVKNWDKVASELTTKPKSKSEKKDDAGNDTKEADSDEEGGDGVDSFFKKLYAGADPDTRRAMMKSYVESQGTSLSTNWGEVGQGKVEPKP